MRTLYDTLQKQTRMTPEIPYSGFYELYKKELTLLGVDGYNPLMAQITRLSSNKNNTLLLLERAAPPPDFLFKGAKFSSFEMEGKGGNLLYYEADSNVQRSRNLKTGLKWLSTGLIVVGDPNLLTAQTLTMGPQTSTAVLTIKSDADDDEPVLKSPMFRLRRKYDTSVAVAVLGVGNGVLTEFEYQIPIAKLPICPSSVIIGHSTLADVIRDDGNGNFVNIAPTVHLGLQESSINYLTGKIKLSFSDDHIPTSASITVSYEHSSDKIVDWSTYYIDWKQER